MAFGVLFRLRLRHDYWLNRDAILHEALPAAEAARLRRDRPVSDWIEIVPSRETRRVMAGHGIVFKATHDGALAGIELAGATAVPRRPLGPTDRLRFGLRGTDPLLDAYTADLAGFALYSNASGNLRGGERHLSRPVAGFDAQRGYRAGDLRATYAGADTQLFQALRDTGPSANPVAADWRRVPAITHDPAQTYGLGDIVLSGDHLFEAAKNAPGANLALPADWTDLGPLANQYATLADAVTLRPAVFSLDVSAAAATRIDTELRRPGAPAILQARRFEDTTPLQTVPVDLSGFGEGPFELTLRDASGAALPALGLSFTVCGEAGAQGWRGMIEIGAGAGEFALTDNAGQIRAPVFDLRFANQAAVFRYRFPAPQPVGAGAEVAPSGTDPADLVSPAPRPLTRSGNGVLLREDNPATANVVERILLPNVGPNQLRKEAGRWVATGYLPNFPPLS